MEWARRFESGEMRRLSPWKAISQETKAGVMRQLRVPSLGLLWLCGLLRQSLKQGVEMEMPRKIDGAGVLPSTRDGRTTGMLVGSSLFLSLSEPVFITLVLHT